MLTRSSHVKWIGLLLITLAFVLPGCVGLDDGPRITTVTITPSTVPASETGMTNEFIDITIGTAGFVEQPMTGSATIQANGREATPTEIVVETDDTVLLNGIAKSWLGGLSAGTYDIEVAVSNDTESVRQANSATITITE